MSDSTPICRCRVLYLGSSVPQVTKDGLQGIQEPLQELYPEQGAVGARGIDSWLSVWSNGILLENVDENNKKITRFFPIESLHYCAAIRYVLVPEKNTLHNPTPRFLPLDSPFARSPNPAHPPLFAAILRRTTGIKVLECHAFICKREVAANALVRCCFHAYADSSYAKQVEGTGSVYGTLNGDRESRSGKEKLDEWKLPRSQSGSTLTLNTVGNIKDDISIYNGDENHKVWAGSQDNLDQIYDVYSNSTLSRPQRPRQIVQPVAVPPPPAPKEKQKKKSKKFNNKEELYMNGHAGKANSISGTGLHHQKSRSHLQLSNMHHQIPPQPLYIMQHPPHHNLNQSTTLPNPKYFKHHGNTFSHRPNSKKMIMGPRPIPPPFIPISPLSPINPLPPMILSPTTLQSKKNKKGKYHSSANINLQMEEPIYISAGRTLPPPNGGGPPFEGGYIMSPQGHQIYATMEPQGRPSKKNKEKEKMLSGSNQMIMVPYPTLMNGNSSNNGIPVMNNGMNGINGIKDKEAQAKMMMMRDKKLAKSMNGLDVIPDNPGPANPNNLSDESPFNTGIYRKKGHLNERAFSYSIRQEHRSRSYGSLANLKFATPIPNGVNDTEDTREDIKKEREIMQMVQDLDLSGDDIERSEVPRGMYEPRNGGPYGQPPVLMNGNRGHRR